VTVEDTLQRAAPLDAAWAAQHLGEERQVLQVLLCRVQLGDVRWMLRIGVVRHHCWPVRRVDHASLHADLATLLPQLHARHACALDPTVQLHA
jgi:hypothetical protein